MTWDLPEDDRGEAKGKPRKNPKVKLEALERELQYTKKPSKHH